MVLSELEPEALLALGPELFPLVPFARTDRDRIRRGIVRWWREVRRSPGMSDEIADRLWTRFVSFLIARFDRDTLMEITHLIEGAAMSIEKTRAGQDLIAIGKKRGRRTGKREGKREGIRQGLVESILQALEVRFGAVPEDVPAALERFEDPEVLREILRLALSARDARRFRRGLAALGGGG